MNKKRDCFATLAMTGQRCAFTLSEVLIVLAVLGVIAAMTIPDLIQDYREKATVTAVKRVYSVLNQAVDITVANNGPIETWDWGTWNRGTGTGTSSLTVFENIKSNLKVEKDCGTGTGCWSTGNTKNLYGGDLFNFDSATDRVKVILADGTSLALFTYGGCSVQVGTSNALKHTCGSIYVDVNGKKSPNTVGKDVFVFWMTADGVIPCGTSDDTERPMSTVCKYQGTSSYNGEGCAAWVIKKENMDYLRKDISW